jgi:K+-sensing histidine kinase KdpD
MANIIVEAHGGSIRSERLGSKGLRLVFSLTQEDNAAAQPPPGM